MHLYMHLHLRLHLRRRLRLTAFCGPLAGMVKVSRITIGPIRVRAIVLTPLLCTTMLWLSFISKVDASLASSAPAS